MPTTTPLAGPVVHLNGTDKVELMERYRSALDALRLAHAQCRATYPHARDYPNGGWQAASDAHYARLAQLVAVIDELVSLTLHVDDQPDYR